MRQTKRLNKFFHLHLSKIVSGFENETEQRKLKSKQIKITRTFVAEI